MENRRHGHFNTTVTLAFIHYLFIQSVLQTSSCILIYYINFLTGRSEFKKKKVNFTDEILYSYKWELEQMQGVGKNVKLTVGVGQLFSTQQ